MELVSAFLWIATALLVPISAIGDKIECYTYRSNRGCYTEGNTFTYSSSGTSITPNSQCARNFRIQVAPLTGSDRSFYCYAYMNVPEYLRNIYSFSHSNDTVGSTLYTPFIKGYGQEAQVRARKSRFEDFSDDMRWQDAHGNPGTNHYSWIRFWFGDQRINVKNSAGQHTAFSSPLMFMPTQNVTYIGVNRLYPTGAYRGSGLCRLLCKTSPWPVSVESFDPPMGSPSNDQSSDPAPRRLSDFNDDPSFPENEPLTGSRQRNAE